MFVIVRRRVVTATVWLKSEVPERWGPEEHAMQFHTRGEARRAAAAINVMGACVIEEVEAPSEATR